MNVQIERLKEQLKNLAKQMQVIKCQILDLAYNDAYMAAKQKEADRIAEMQERVAAYKIQQVAAKKAEEVAKANKAEAKRIKELEEDVAKIEAEAAAKFEEENEAFKALAEEEEQAINEAALADDVVIDPEPEEEEPDEAPAE